jgi:hypothetical protein
MLGINDRLGARSVPRACPELCDRIGRKPPPPSGAFASGRMTDAPAFVMTSESCHGLETGHAAAAA